MEQTASVNDFTTGSIPKKLFRFMIPILGSLVLQAMYGAVDLLVVGHFGSTEGLSGVSTGSNIMNLVTFVITAYAMGVTVLIGKYLGEGKPEKIGKLLGATIAIFTVIGIGLMFILVGLAGQISTLMQAPAEAYTYTVQYIRICGCGILFIVAYNVLSAVFRGLGDSKSPLIFVLVACIVNVIGDLTLVAGFHMNAAGAAIATVLAQVVSVILAIVLLIRKKLPFRMTRRDIGFNSEIPHFSRIGFPMALQELMTQISFMCLVAFINRLGLDASSGYGVANKIVAFVMLIPSALSQSMSAFVAQNVGAGKEERSRKAMYTGMLIGASIGLVVFIFVYFKGDLLARAFTSDTAVIERAWQYLRGFAPEAIVTAFLFSFMGYFNGHEKSLFVMLQSLAQTFIVRLPLAWYMSIQPGVSLQYIGIAAPTATVFGIIINLVDYIHFIKKIRSQHIADASHSYADAYLSTDAYLKWAKQIFYVSYVTEE